MRTDQLVALVRRHAKLAFKEGRATQKKDKLAAKRWCTLRVAAFAQIVNEIDPYRDDTSISPGKLIDRYNERGFDPKYNQPEAPDLGPRRY